MELASSVATDNLWRLVILIVTLILYQLIHYIDIKLLYYILIFKNSPLVNNMRDKTKSNAQTDQQRETLILLRSSATKEIKKESRWRRRRRKKKETEKKKERNSKWRHHRGLSGFRVYLLRSNTIHGGSCARHEGGNTGPGLSLSVVALSRNGRLKYLSSAA